MPVKARRPSALHYYGGHVRALFVTSALVLIVSATSGAQLPLSEMGTVFTAILLMLAAGITNPEQYWIHWINEGFSLVGTVLFATTAIDYYRMGLSFVDRSFLATEALAILSLVALYYTTKTVRGLSLRHKLS